MGNWFYVQDGNRVGPVSEEQLKTLYQAGAIEGESLIWQKGLREWVKYDVQFPPPPGAKKPAKKDPPPKAAAATPAAKPPPPPAEAYQAGGATEPPQQAAPPARRPPPEPVREAKVPKPLPSKGTENRWKTMGPTFQLAGGKAPLQEETSGSATVRTKTARPTEPEPEAETGLEDIDGIDETPVTQPATPPPAEPTAPPPAEAPPSPAPATSDAVQATARLLKLNANPHDISIDGPTERAICKECEKPFPVTMMDKFGANWVCKLCQAREREKYEKEMQRKNAGKGMFSGTFEKVLLALAIVALLATIGWSIKGKLFKAVEQSGTMLVFNSKLPPTEWVNKPTADWPPLVMVNFATFAESSNLQGGSGFLLKDKSNTIVGATSSTLLHPNFGVYPPVHPSIVQMVLGDWKMFSNAAPDRVLRFNQIYQDPAAYMNSPVMFLEPAQTIPAEYPVEVLTVQNRTVQNGEFVYVVTIQPVRERYVQSVFKGVAYTSDGTAGMNIMIELDETVSDMEVPGAPVLDANGHVVAMVIGARPFQGHIPFEDFEQVLYSRSNVAPMERRRDATLVQRLYAADLRTFPATFKQ